jgi:hypothetical protein
MSAKSWAGLGAYFAFHSSIETSPLGSATMYRVLSPIFVFSVLAGFSNRTAALATSIRISVGSLSFLTKAHAFRVVVNKGRDPKAERDIGEARAREAEGARTIKDAIDAYPCAL